MAAILPARCSASGTAATVWLGGYGRRNLRVWDPANWCFDRSWAL